MEKFEVSYWDTLVETLSSTGYVVFALIISCVLLAVLISILVTGTKDGWMFRSIMEGAVTAFGIAVFVLGFGLTHASMADKENSYYANINQSIIDKYDLDLLEMHNVEEQDNGAIHMKAKIASYELGVSKGYGSYESRSDKRKDLANIAIGADGVPYILPWEGVDKDFVESLER